MVIKTRDGIDIFLENLAAFKSARVFNPWSSNCEEVDNENSFDVRLKNLHTVLRACADANEVDLWIGRDLGWRGGRRTGVALVDEATLVDYASSINASGLTKATVGPAMKERTATEIHLARKRVSRKIFFWNVFPFHPHEDNKPHSNRMHTRAERDLGLSFLNNILELLPIRRALAIGNDATRAVQKIDLEFYSVRHPSYGGQQDFHRQVDAHYGLVSNECTQKSLFDGSM
ncbi:MAG: Uracil DNA glycosylase superfamily [Halomonas sp. HL-48]|nr:uracil-DNA glycosylase [Halomonas sp. HL-48]KPQ24581.1 MAG: Uracil DNA glycosylase superfamily [Halomonas sp. HL-48]